MVYCANGICGSLGRFSGLGQVSMRWGPAGRPSDEEVFGRGCDPSALPVGEERDLVDNLIEVERTRQHQLNQCSGQRKAMCQAGVSTGMAPQLAAKQDAITAYCMTRDAGLLPDDYDAGYDPGYGPTTTDTGPVDTGPTDPIETQAGMSGTTKLAIVGGALVLVLGAGYMFTRRGR
jgi:hypothetical protein